MAPLTPTDEELIRRLNAHPHVRRRVESMLSVVEDESGDLKLADAAGMRMIEDVRRMGQEVLQAWASWQTTQCSHEVTQTQTAWREGKKN